MFEWLFDIAASEDAADHFAALPGPTGYLLVGLGVLVYHRLVLTERDAGEVRRTDPERLYRYLVAAAGVLTLGGGLTMAIAMALDALLPASDFIRDTRWWREELAVLLTMLIVGAPLWARYWSASQRVAQEPGVEGALERASLPRRAFLFVIFGVAALVVLVNLAILLFQVFDALLDEGIGAGTLRDVRWSVALLVTAGAISTYYWLVLRDDQAATALAEPSPAPASPLAVRDVLLLAPVEDAPALSDALAARGVRVRRWLLDAPTPSAAAPPDVDALLALLDRFEGTSAVVLVEDGVARVIAGRAG